MWAIVHSHQQLPVTTQLFGVTPQAWDLIRLLRVQRLSVPRR